MDRYAALKSEHAELGRVLHASRQRIAVLESEVRRGNQLRADVAKRIDDLVGQIDQIEGRFATDGN
jgi:rRNA processing protein Gar1